MTDFIIKLHADQLAPAADGCVLVEGGGFDVFTGGEVVLGPHRARIFNAKPVEYSLVSCTLPPGGEIEHVTVIGSHLLGAEIDGCIIDDIVGAGHVAVGGV